MKSLFLTGYIQVFFVSVNTYFLAQAMYLGVIGASFMISMVWSYNVRRVVIGTLRDRVVYSLGATFGSVTGLFLSVLINKII